MSRGNKNVTGLVKEIIDKNRLYDDKDSFNRKNFEDGFIRKFRNFLNGYYFLVTKQELEFDKISDDDFKGVMEGFVQITEEEDLRNDINSFISEITYWSDLYKMGKENCVEQIEFLFSVRKIIQDIYLATNARDEELSNQYERQKAIYILMLRECGKNYDDSILSYSKDGIDKSLKLAQLIEKEQKKEKKRQLDEKREKFWYEKLVRDIMNQRCSVTAETAPEHVELYDRSIRLCKEREIDYSHSEEVKKIIQEVLEEVKKENEELNKAYAEEVLGLI